MSPGKQRMNGFVLVALILLITMLAMGVGCRKGPAESGETIDQSGSTSSTETTTVQSQEKAEDVFDQFARYWMSDDYRSMYGLLSSDAQAAVSEEAFITRYQNIFSGIEASDLHVERIQTDESSPLIIADEQSKLIPFSVQMNTLAGTVSLTDYQAELRLEDTTAGPHWRIDWSEKLIFPNMQSGDKVQAKVLNPQRGEIYDRNQHGLAVNGELISIGIAPGKFGPVHEEAIPLMAERLGISEEKIRSIFESADQPEWFYPIVTLPSGANDLAAELTQIDGVLYQKIQGRVYPAGEAAGLLIGYIGPITAEELAKREGQGYTPWDKIGKMGLEQVYEERLRGKRGGEIIIVDGESGQLKDIISRQEAVNGETITLAMDVTTQIKLYNQMKEDAGAAAAIDPVSGEILALVSSPSFDPNYLQTYVPDVVQESWNTAEKSYFQNRFKMTYAPGSVFKLITASVGLKAGVTIPDEALPIVGKRWQNSAGWGDYHVTRVKDIGRPVTLRDALVYSDNIYFAQQALRIGAETLEAGARLFGIGEPLPIDYPFYDSQLSNNGLGREVLLADTGYGQGEVLTSPLHIAIAYGALATDGDVMKPVLELKGDLASVWNRQAIPSEYVGLLTDILLENVESPEGTGYTNPAAAVRMLGKTGTAELKASYEDTEAEENGWFVAMSVDQPQCVIAMMIEDVKERGGSHYVVPLVKQAMDAIILE